MEIDYLDRMLSHARASRMQRKYWRKLVTLVAFACNLTLVSCQQQSQPDSNIDEKQTSNPGSGAVGQPEITTESKVTLFHSERQFESSQFIVHLTSERVQYYALEGSFITAWHECELTAIESQAWFDLLRNVPFESFAGFYAPRPEAASQPEMIVETDGFWMRFSNDSKDRFIVARRSSAAPQSLRKLIDQFESKAVTECAEKEGVTRVILAESLDIPGNLGMPQDKTPAQALLEGGQEFRTLSGNQVERDLKRRQAALSPGMLIPIDAAATGSENESIEYVKFEGRHLRVRRLQVYEAPEVQSK